VDARLFRKHPESEPRRKIAEAYRPGGLQSCAGRRIRNLTACIRTRFSGCAPLDISLSAPFSQFRVLLDRASCVFVMFRGEFHAHIDGAR
jgi:hypothetical protein